MRHEDGNGYYQKISRASASLAGVGIHRCSTIAKETSIHWCMDAIIHLQVGEKILTGLQSQLQEKYNLKAQRIRDADGEREVKILNRVVRNAKHGYKMEADPRHAELVLEQMLGKDNIGNMKASSPGNDADDKKGEDSDIQLDGQEVRMFRSIAARCLYLCLDRLELQFSVKEMCRLMSNPTISSWKKLHRVSKFICACPRLVWDSKWQVRQTNIWIYGDSNWASCPTTRKSTSGGDPSRRTLHQDMVQNADVNFEEQRRGGILPSSQGSMRRSRSANVSTRLGRRSVCQGVRRCKYSQKHH